MPIISTVGGSVSRFRKVLTSSPPIVTTFSFTGADQSYVIPAGVTQVGIYLWGAGGTAGGLSSLPASGGPGGAAGAVEHLTFAVTPGETLTIRVGQSQVVLQQSAGTTDAAGRNIAPFGGGGPGGIGDGGGANGSFGSPGGGATSILRSGVFVATAAGGGGGGGPGYPTGAGFPGGPGGAGNALGGLGPGTTAGEGGNGADGGGGGGGGGSGSSQNAGAGVGGNGGTNLVPPGGTGFNGSGTTPGNTASAYYAAGVGLGGAAAVGTGIDLSGGDGYAVIVVGGSTVESYT